MRTVILDRSTFNLDINFTAIEQQVAEFTSFNTTSPEQVLSRSQQAEIIITNKVVLSEAILSQLPNLKLVCIAATGTNNVDLAAAKKLGIAVTNVSGYAKESVVQYVFAQLLAYFSKTFHHNSNSESWPSSDTFCLLGNGYNEVAGKTLGIIGYGSLGQAVETVAHALGMKTLIAERQNAETIRTGRVAFEEVLQQADVISLHCPHTPDTEELINENSLALMKKSSLLINTARGAVVNEQALYNALKNKQIEHAILDVLQQEPPSADNPLLSNELSNISITGHIAWASNQAQLRLIKGIANNIQSFKKGELLNRVEL